MRLDTSRARAMPGVRAVVTASDVPSVLAGWIIRDTPMFASKVVRYIGEPIAAVAADTLDEARRALDAIELASSRRARSAPLPPRSRQTRRSFIPI